MIPTGGRMLLYQNKRDSDFSVVSIPGNGVDLFGDVYSNYIMEQRFVSL